MSTYPACGSRPCSQAPMSFLVPRRYGELMLALCLLGWAGERAPIYLL